MGGFRAVDQEGVRAVFTAARDPAAGKKEVVSEAGVFVALPSVLRPSILFF